MGIWNPFQRMFNRRVDHSQTPTDNQIIRFDSGANTWGVEDAPAGAQTPVVADIDYDGFNMLDGGIIKLREQAEADADTAGAGQIWVDLQTPNKLFFTDDAGTDFDLTAGGTSNFTQRIPLVMEVPESTIAFPDIHALATQTSKISGFVMPDGATASEVNFKGVVPNDLNATPAASIKFYIMTLGAVAGPADVRLTVSTSANADTEDMDDAFAVETEQTVTMPIATETLDIYDQDMTTDPTAGDILTVQLRRDPTDAADDFTDDVLIVAAFLEIDRTTT